jgi:hypothetical protein
VKRRSILGLAPVTLLAAACLSGCGDSRAFVPSLTHPLLSRHFRTLHYAKAGLTISLPRGWLVARTHRPLLVVAASGNATLALWRYVRFAPVPSDPVTLNQARLSLIAAVRAKQPGIDLVSSLMLQLDHHPTVVLEAVERIRGLTRRVRSVHIYAPGEEVVLDEYAPPAVFELVSHQVFVPVRRSLVLAAS